MEYPTTIKETEESITSWRNSGLTYDYAVDILTKHLKILMAYCSRKEKLAAEYNKAKNSYWRRQWGEAMTQIDAMLIDYLKIMNNKTEEHIVWMGLGGC